MEYNTDKINNVLGYIWEFLKLFIGLPAIVLFISVIICLIVSFLSLDSGVWQFFVKFYDPIEHLWIRVVLIVWCILSLIGAWWNNHN